MQTKLKENFVFYQYEKLAAASLGFRISIQFIIHLIGSKYNCRWLDSNRGSLTSYASALPTAPHPLPGNQLLIVPMTYDAFNARFHLSLQLMETGQFVKVVFELKCVGRLVGLRAGVVGGILSKEWRNDFFVFSFFFFCCLLSLETNYYLLWAPTNLGPIL